MLKKIENSVLAEERDNKNSEPVFLGKGRSASVYKLAVSGEPIARKVFTGSESANVIMSLFYGAPVDYQWCEPAVSTAFFRRKVLKHLLNFWFGERLTIANPLTVGKDEQTGSFYLDTEYIEGETANLYNPFSLAHISEYKDLKQRILPKLQQHLREAGFTGTVWQAGYGQPCSIANFLCVKYDDNKNKERWVWIDAESGVPGIASYSVSKLIRFYIPQAIKRRKVLFDDLDDEMLTAYITDRRDELIEHLGERDFCVLEKDVSSLIDENRKWQRETRFTRTISYFRFQNKISREYYENLRDGKASRIAFYFTHYLPEMFDSALGYSLKKIVKLIKTFNPVKWSIFFIISLVSRRYRIEKSRQFVEKRINEWRDLKRIDEQEEKAFKAELYIKETNQYLADFGMFLALKPFGYFVKLIILPVLLLYGIVSPEVAVFIIAFFSISLRLIYTLTRFIEDAIILRVFPYIAVIVAPIPTFGTLAYPCQMIHSAKRGHAISQFIIYEVFSTIAKKVPIWGGYNSELEYFFNRHAFKFIKATE